MKRNLKIILYIGIPLGIALIAVKNIMNIGDSDFWKQYAIMGVVVIAAAVLINCLYQIRFIRNLNLANSRVAKTGDVDTFIKDLEDLLNGSKSEFRKSLILINLSYGYSKKKDYEKGLEALEAINPKNVKGINQIIYLLNMVNFNFYLENYEEVIDITEKNRNVFMKFMGNPKIGWTVAANNICYYIAKNDCTQAESLIAEARAKWTQEEMQEEWQFLEEKCHNR